MSGYRKTETFCIAHLNNPTEIKLWPQNMPAVEKALSALLSFFSLCAASAKSIQIARKRLFMMMRGVKMFSVNIIFTN
jgi:hypothetical protein